MNVLQKISRSVNFILPMCLLSTVILGCQTTSRPSRDISTSKDVTPSVDLLEFCPISPIAAIQFENGRYPDLFQNDSYAIWINSNVVKQKQEADTAQQVEIDPWLAQDAQHMITDFLIIELHLKSVFGDTSIAYDIVGLRGARIYLEKPDGSQIEPIQRVIGAPIKEEQQGALKSFERTNILVFPKKDVWLGTPIFSTDVGVLKLVIESHDSRYVFAWEDIHRTPAPPSSPLEEQLKLIKVGFSELFEQLRRLNRVTQ